MSVALWAISDPDWAQNGTDGQGALSCGESSCSPGQPSPGLLGEDLSATCGTHGAQGHRNEKHTFPMCP